MLSKAFADPRYIRINGKPVFISRVRDRATLHGWRHIASVLGLPSLYLVARCELQSKDGLAPGFDAIMEDPTLGVDVNAVMDVPLIDVNFRGDIYDYSEIMERCCAPIESACVTFRNVITGWDTEPSNPGKSLSFRGSSPALYAGWLDRCCHEARQQPTQERLVFVNSWNDWMAGAHLEPDHRFGYAYLNATANVLRSYYCDESTNQLVKNINAKFSRKSDTAIIFHCFHEDLIVPIFEEYLSRVSGADLIVTARADISYRAVEEMSNRFTNIFIDVHENRGRDIRPFLFALRRVQSLEYRFACKLHTKKTPYAGNGGGELWRETLMRTLLGASDSVLQVRERFDAENDVGLLVPSGSLTELHELRHHIDNTFWLDRLLERMKKTDLIENYAFSFPAGSMFWFRVDALDGLDDLAFGDDEFEQELGQRDGTLAHALERLIVLYALEKGYKTREIDVTKRSSTQDDESRRC
jgi:lipopolysaccharide biosynthesis protein